MANVWVNSITFFAEFLISLTNSFERIFGQEKYFKNISDRIYRLYGCFCGLFLGNKYLFESACNAGCEFIVFILRL